MVTVLRSGEGEETRSINRQPLDSVASGLASLSLSPGVTLMIAGSSDDALPDPHLPASAEPADCSHEEAPPIMELMIP